MSGIILWSASAIAAPEIYTVEQIEQGGKEFLLQNLNWDQSRLAIKVKYEGQGVRLPEGNRTMDCSLPGGHKRVGNLQFICFVKVNGQIKARLRLYADVRLAYEVFQTVRTLNRGHILTPADVRRVRIESSHILRNTVSDEKELLGYELIRGLGEGEDIQTHMIKRVPLVKFGDRILIVAQKGSLRVTAPGVVKQNGFKNDTVQVENLQSQKIILGTVVDSQTVRIDF